MYCLVCGTFALDTILVFPGRFRDQILPEQAHILSVSFEVPAIRRAFGGTAGNIAYSLKALGGNPLPMGSVGTDFGPYAEHLKALGIPLTYALEIPGQETAQAFVTTDAEDNQITAFHPGAMAAARRQSPERVAEALSWAIVSPDAVDAMSAHGAALARRGVPFIFDPGQALPRFSPAALLALVEQATVVTVNDYEAALLAERTGASLAELARGLEALVVTQGARGARFYTVDGGFQQPAVAARRIVDPTGCGDAFRAGLLLGLLRGWDWPASARLAAACGAIQVAYPGPQNHGPALAELAASL